jgi:hypothetical protein
MRTTLIFATLLSIIAAISPLHAQITFERWYGGSGRDYGRSVAQTFDGGYIITGETSSYGGTYDVYLIRTNADGDTTWTRTYGGSGTDYGYSVIQTSDAGFAVAGSYLNEGYFDVYLIKTDSLGDTSWTRTYGGSAHDYGSSVSQTTDGGYIITGYSEHEPYFHHVYIVKTDSLGNTSWTKTYGGVYDERAYAVEQTSDGGYIIAGETSSYGAGAYDVYLLKTDSLGDTCWTRTYGGTDYDRGHAVKQTLDGGYIIAGNTTSFGAGLGDVYLIKVDSLGNTGWTKTYGGTDSDGAESIARTSDGGYIITGFTSYAIDSCDVYLIKTDSIGDTAWTRTYGGTGWEWGDAVAQTQDGGYIIAGNTDSYGAGLNDVYLIKTDANGLVGIQEEHHASKSKNTKPALTCTPNPFTTGTSVELLGAGLKYPIELRMYDVNGRLLLNRSLATSTLYLGTDLCPGIYFISVDGIAKQKIIKVR